MHLAHHTFALIGAHVSAWMQVQATLLKDENVRLKAAAASRGVQQRRHADATVSGQQDTGQIEEQKAALKTRIRELEYEVHVARTMYLNGAGWQVLLL